jgi:hypothetical protein
MRKLTKIRARALKEDPAHIRKPEVEAELRSLGQSVITHQEVPLIVRPNDVIFDGHRRRAGVMLINPDHELECIVTDEDLDPFEVQLVTATQKNLGLCEQFRAMSGWRERHPEAPLTALAERCGLSAGTVTKILSLSKCIPAWHEAAEAGIAGVSDCYAASQLDAQGQHELLEMLKAGGKRDELQAASRKRRNGAPQGDRLQKVRIALPRGAVTISGKELGMEQVVETLAEVLKDARKAAEQYDVKTWMRMMADKAKGG